MSLIFIIVIFGSQLILVFTGNPSLDEVRALIKKVQGEADAVKISNVKLYSQISDVQTESSKKISDYSVEKYNLSTEFKNEMDKLKMLHSNLTELYEEEQKVIREANLVKVSRQKLDLGTKLLEDDVEQLESRRKKGHEDTCLKILPSIKDTKLRLRSALNSTDEDEMIVLTNELEQEKSQLNDVTNKNEELQMVLKDKIKLSKTALKNLESMIKEIDGDLSKARVRVQTLTEKCDKKRDEISSLKENLNEDLKFVKAKKESLSNLRDSMVGFGKAILCYNKLEEEVFHKNY